MHTQPMSETEGRLGEPVKSDIACPKCKKTGGVTYQIWESHDGAYEDEKYSCGSCGHVWWVEGPDS